MISKYYQSSFGYFSRPIPFSFEDMLDIPTYKRKKQKSLLSEPRYNHFYFAHYMLRYYCSPNPEHFLYMMRSEDRIETFELLLKEVEKICGSYGVEYLTAEKIKVTIHKAKQYPLVLIEMPEAKAIMEAVMIGVVIMPDVVNTPENRSYRYFTLDLGRYYDEGCKLTFCEWEGDSHSNYGEIPDSGTVKESFIKAIESHI